MAFDVGANLPHTIPKYGGTACFAGFDQVPLIEVRGLKTGKEVREGAGAYGGLSLMACLAPDVVRRYTS